MISDIIQNMRTILFAHLMEVQDEPEYPHDSLRIEVNYKMRGEIVQCYELYQHGELSMWDGITTLEFMGVIVETCEKHGDPDGDKCKFQLVNKEWGEELEGGLE